MHSIKFGNKKGLNIASDVIKNDIKSLVKSLGTFDIKGKYYNFLNKRNINSLKNNKFLVTPSTFGKKFVLFLSIYKNKNYCIFINKKNEIMVISRFRFNIDLFSGTLFDGEFIKEMNGNWVYIINDIAYYKGKNIITLNFTERYEIINDILKYEYESDSNLSVCSIILKEYFELKYIKDLCKNYLNNLDYKTSGLYFKNVNNFSENYLYIFPECRSDLKENFNISEKEQNKINKINKINKDIEKLDEYNKKTCIFTIKRTNLPDIYDLFTNNSYNILENYSIVGVPSIETSVYLKKVFKESENNNINFECEYNKKFKKWIPLKVTDNNVDNINLVNIIQNKNEEI